MSLKGMSLKAKLEAVIYAAEEPVTLGQLAVLFADEALALKAEQDSAAQPQADASAIAETENLSLLGDESLADLSIEPEAQQDSEAGGTAESGGGRPESGAETAGEEAG